VADLPGHWGRRARLTRQTTGAESLRLCFDARLAGRRPPRRPGLQTHSLLDRAAAHPTLLLDAAGAPVGHGGRLQALGLQRQSGSAQPALASTVRAA